MIVSEYSFVRAADSHWLEATEDGQWLQLKVFDSSIAINSTLVSHRLADLRLGTQVIAVGILIVTPLVMSSALRMICGVMKTNNVDMVVCWVRFLNR